MNEKREKGLCYNCDEKYAPRHGCTTQTLHLLNDDIFDYSKDENIFKKEANEP